MLENVTLLSPNKSMLPGRYVSQSVSTNWLTVQTNMCVCVRLYSVCVQEDTVDLDPSVVGAICDAVNRHPNLTEVTVKGFGRRSIITGLVKGVLQKAGVRKVDVMVRWPKYLDHLSLTPDLGKCTLACVLSAVGSLHTADSVPVCAHTQMPWMIWSRSTSYLQ